MQNRNFFVRLAFSLLVIFVILMIWLAGPSWMLRYKMDEKEPYDLNIAQEYLQTVYEDDFIEQGVSLELLEWDSTKQTTLVALGKRGPQLRHNGQLLEKFVVEQGNTLFIGIENIELFFPTIIKDWEVSEELNQLPNDFLYDYIDTLTILDQTEQYPIFWQYKDKIAPNDINMMRPTIDSLSTKGWLYDDIGNPVAATFKIGKGKIIIVTTPLLFTNYYLSKEKYFPIFTKVFARMKAEQLIWTGNFPTPKTNPITGEPNNQKSPLYFIFDHKPLKIAWYTLLVLSALFIVFYGKRKHRIIPLRAKKINTSLIYLENLATALSRKNRNHWLFKEMINQLDDALHQKYYIEKHWTLNKKIAFAREKPGINEEQLLKLWRLQKKYSQQQQLTKKDLATFYQAINPVLSTDT